MHAGWSRSPLYAADTAATRQPFSGVGALSAPRAAVASDAALLRFIVDVTPAIDTTSPTRCAIVYPLATPATQHGQP